MLRIFILALLLSLLLLSCNLFDSDEEENPIHQLPDITQSSFAVYASAQSQMIYVVLTGSIPINSLCILIDGEEVTCSRDFAYYPFQEGETYNIEITVNGIYHQITDLTIACEPECEFPHEYVAGENTKIEWNMDKDARTQYLYFENADTGRDDPYPYKTLIYMNPRDRSYSMDAELFGYTGESTISIQLVECNWETSGEFFFYSFAYGSNDDRISEQKSLTCH